MQTTEQAIGEAKRVAVHARLIKANADDFCSDKISYAEFTQKARRLWNSVPAHLSATVAAIVCPMVRQ